MKPVAIIAPAEIVDDIVEQLRPLKRGVDTPQADILDRIKGTSVVLAHPAPRLTAAVRQKAARAAKALAALEKDMPAFAGFDFVTVWTALEGIAHGKGPDPRCSSLDWVCVYQAYALVEKFSERRPMRSQSQCSSDRSTAL